MITIKSSAYKPDDFYAVLNVIKAGVVMICGGNCGVCKNKIACYDLKEVESYLESKINTHSKNGRS